MQLLSVIGISLHPVQDFYAHTNWVETRGAAATARTGRRAARPHADLVRPSGAGIRDGARIYAGGSNGDPRPRGLERRQRQHEPAA